MANHNSMTSTEEIEMQSAVGDAATAATVTGGGGGGDDGDDALVGPDWSKELDNRSIISLPPLPPTPNNENKNENKNKPTKVLVSVEGKYLSPITAAKRSRTTSTVSTTRKSTTIATAATTTTKRNNSNSNNNSLLEAFELLLSQPRLFKKRKTANEMNSSLVLPRRPTLLSSVSSKTRSTAISAGELSDNNNADSSTNTSRSRSAPINNADTLRIEEDVDNRSDNDDNDEDEDDNAIDDDQEQNSDDDDDDDDDQCKYDDKLSAGCVTYGEKEEMYDDVVFRKSKGWKTRMRRRMKYLKLHHSRMSKRKSSSSNSNSSNSSSKSCDGDGDDDVVEDGSRIRILFSSTVDPKDVADVLQYMIQQKFFHDHKKHQRINHLAFGLVEVVNDYARDVRPMSFPIKMFGAVLKSMHTSTTTHQCQSTNNAADGDGGGGILQSLNVKNIQFMGTRHEFTETFEYLADCETIREFICDACCFRIVGDTSSLRKRKKNRNHTTTTPPPPPPPLPPQAKAYNIQIFNLLFEALNEIDALEVLSINDVELRQCSHSFNKILLRCNNDDAGTGTDRNKKKTTNRKQQHQQRPRPQRKKKMKVLAIGDCTISDRTLEAMFGENSRVEKLCLLDVILSTEQKSQISTLLRRTKSSTKSNRNSRPRPHTHTAPNNTSQRRRRKRRSCCHLKFLLLRWMDHPYLTVPQTISLMDALEMNDTLKVLHLDVECYKDVLCTMAPTFIESLQRVQGLQFLHVTFNGMRGQQGLECIKSIVRGFEQNTTIRKVDFLVSGYQEYHRQQEGRSDPAAKEAFRTTFTQEMNASLLHALTSPQSRCVLQEFYLYVDGKFPITLTEEIAFWLAMNENKLKQTVRQHPDDVHVWNEAILQHRNNPHIIYHLLRQNHALLLPATHHHENTTKHQTQTTTTPTIETKEQQQPLKQDTREGGIFSN